MITRNSISKGNVDPNWSEKFTFTDIENYDVLIIEINDQNRFRKSDFLGIVYIPIGELENKQSYDDWFTLGKIFF